MSQYEPQTHGFAARPEEILAGLPCQWCNMTNGRHLSNCPHNPNAVPVVETHKDLPTGDFREKKVPFQLKTVVLVGDPNSREGGGTWAEYIRPLLDTLNSLPGLVRGEAFTMSLVDTDIDLNLYKLVLEFETE